MPILEDVKVLLSKESDSSIDAALTILKSRAVTVVKNYLNNANYDAAYIEENFADAVIQLTYNAFSVKGKENIQSESQGSRSVSYKTFTSFSDGSTFTITQDVKALLPKPSIKMR